jgi:hypothetical protein
LEAIEIEDQAAEVFAQLPDDGDYDQSQKLENILQQLVDMHESLTAKIDASKATNKDRADQSLATIAKMHKSVAEKVFASAKKLALSI